MTDIRIHRPQITNQNVQKPKPTEDTTKYIPEKVKEVAKSYEKEFAKLMINEMQKSVSKYSNDSSANFYSSLLTDEQAQSMTEKNGIGLQKMILDQVYPEHLRNKANYDYHTKSQIPKKPEIAMHDHPKRPEIIKKYGQYAGESHE